MSKLKKQWNSEESEIKLQTKTCGKCGNIQHVGNKKFSSVPSVSLKLIEITMELETFT